MLGGTGTLTTTGISNLTTPTGNLTLSKNWTNQGTANWLDTVARNLNISVGDTLTNNVGGTLNLNASDQSSIAGAGALQNNGTLTMLATGTNIISTTFSNAGTVNVNSGTLKLTSVYAQTGGGTLLNGGTLDVSASNFVLGGGTLSGIGTISGNVNNSGGLVSPGVGLSPGSLTISGNYTQGPLGALQIEMGGTIPVQQFSVLNVLGNVALSGALDVLFVNGFIGAKNDTFQIMTYGTNKGGTTFTQYNYPSGFGFQPQYGGHNLVLKEK